MRVCNHRGNCWPCFGQAGALPPDEAVGGCTWYADSADGNGTARLRTRRQGCLSDRRSARDTKSCSIARCAAANPLSCSGRFRSSTRSPPARFRETTAGAVWMSSTPGDRQHGHGGGLQQPIRCDEQGGDTAAKPPGTSAHRVITPPHTGNQERAVPASHTPLVSVCDSQTQTISLIYRNQRGTELF